MTASISVPIDYDLVSILKVAGVTDFETVLYADGVLEVEGVEQSVLDAALATYSHDAYLLRRLLDTIAMRRYEAETADISVNGMIIRTDRESQGLILGGVVEAMMNPDYMLRWKTPEGFIQLDAATVIAIGRMVRAHVQACFNREEEIEAAARAGTFDPAMLEQGWPV